MINRELSEAVTELNEVLNNTSIDILKRIPKSFLQFVAENTLESYEFKYDKTKSLKDQNLKQKTKGLIALIYRDFLCDDINKDIYNKKVSDTLKEIELEKREKYNPDNIFEKTENVQNVETIKNTGNIENIKQNQTVEETNLIEKQENLFSKIIKKIKSFFLKK